MHKRVCLLLPASFVLADCSSLTKIMMEVNKSTAQTYSFSNLISFGSRPKTTAAVFQGMHVPKYITEKKVNAESVTPLNHEKNHHVFKL